MVLSNWLDRLAQRFSERSSARSRKFRPRLSGLSTIPEALEQRIFPVTFFITPIADDASDDMTRITEGRSVAFEIQAWPIPASSVSISYTINNAGHGLDGTAFEFITSGQIEVLEENTLVIPTFDDTISERLTNFTIHFFVSGGHLLAGDVGNQVYPVYVFDNDARPPSIDAPSPAMIFLYTWSKPAGGVALALTSGSVLGRISASDPNPNDVLTFSGGNSMFSISPNGDVVSLVNQNLYNSPSQSYYVTATVTDSTGLTDTKTIRVIWIQDEFTDAVAVQGYAEIDVATVGSGGTITNLPDHNSSSWATRTIDFGTVPINVQQSTTLQIRNVGSPADPRPSWATPPTGMTDALLLGKWTIPSGLYVAPADPTEWSMAWRYALQEDSTLERMIIPNGATATGGTGLANDGSFGAFDLVLLPQDAGLFEGIIYVENNDNWLWDRTAGTIVREGDVHATYSSGTWTTSTGVSPGSNYYGQLNYSSTSYNLSYGSQSNPNGSSNPGGIGDSQDEGIFGIRVRALVEGPEISVALEGSSSELLDGTGAVTFEGTLPGVPLTKTLVVTNKGTSNLVLQPVTISGPFTLVTNFTSGQVVAPGGSTTLTIQYDAVDGGSQTGALSFSNNDFNEGLFELALTGTVTAPEIGVAVQTGPGTTSSVTS